MNKVRRVFERDFPFGLAGVLKTVFHSRYAWVICNKSERGSTTYTYTVLNKFPDCARALWHNAFIDSLKNSFTYERIRTLAGFHRFTREQVPGDK